MHQLETQICGLGQLGRTREPEKVNRRVLTTAPSFAAPDGYMSKACRGGQLRIGEAAGPKKDHSYLGNLRWGIIN